MTREDEAVTRWNLPPAGTKCARALSSTMLASRLLLLFVAPPPGGFQSVLPPRDQHVVGSEPLRARRVFIFVTCPSPNASTPAYAIIAPLSCSTRPSVACSVPPLVHRCFLLSCGLRLHPTPPTIRTSSALQCAIVRSVISTSIAKIVSWSEAEVRGGASPSAIFVRARSWRVSIRLRLASIPFTGTACPRTSTPLRELLDVIPQARVVDRPISRATDRGSRRRCRRLRSVALLVVRNHLRVAETYRAGVHAAHTAAHLDVPDQWFRDDGLRRSGRHADADEPGHAGPPVRRSKSLGATPASSRARRTMSRITARWCSAVSREETRARGVMYVLRDNQDLAVRADDPDRDLVRAALEPHRERLPGGSLRPDRRRGT